MQTYLLLMKLKPQLFNFQSFLNLVWERTKMLFKGLTTSHLFLFEGIWLKQAFPHFFTLFSVYIDKLEGCLVELDYIDMSLSRNVIILLLYVDDFVLLAGCPCDLDKQLRTLKKFCTSMDMTINIDKTKVIIVKSNKVT